MDIIKKIKNAGFYFDEAYEGQEEPIIQNGVFFASNITTDIRYTKDKKEIRISNQGLYWSASSGFLKKENDILDKKRAIRFVGFYDFSLESKDKTVYENVNGQFPSEEFINKFIS
jgi:hypothetical protein